MLRGLLSGTILGTATAGVLLVAASPFVARVEIGGATPETGEVAVPAGSGFNAERPDEPPALPSTEGRPAGEAPTLATNESGADALDLDTSPAGTPDTGQIEGAISSPSSSETGSVQTEGEEAVTAGTGGAQLAQPGLETAPEAEVAVLTPETGGDTAALPGTSSEIDAPVIATGETSVSTPSVGAAPDSPNPESNPTAEGSAETPETGNEPSGLATPSITVETPSLPDTGGDSLSLPSFGSISPGAGEDSLPNIGAGPAAPSDVAAEPAIVRYATAFEPISDKPRLAIVLLDDPSVDPSGFGDSVVPFAISVDPNSDGVGARMAALRAAGLEVIVQAPLPSGASPADIEVSFQGFLNAVPQAVAVMDSPEVSLQESRPRAAQVVDILKTGGYGLLMYSKGLNSALQIAEREELAAAKITRVFDAGDGDAAAMVRALDQGAFQTSQGESVVLVGMLRPETLAAVTEWSTGNRASTVEMAPVSAVLSGK